MDLSLSLPFRLHPNAAETTDFDLNPELRPKRRTLRDAAVLIPLMRRDGKWFVVLTKRSADLPDHPGQIAFPGGKVDQGDGTALNAALREAEEEIGLPKDAVQVIGALARHETVTGYSVSPYVALIEAPFEPQREVGEVDEVFLVPIEHVTEPRHFSIQSRGWMGKRRSYYAVPYGPYYIWGATARMLRNLCDSLERIHED